VRFLSSVKQDGESDTQHEVADDPPF